MIAPSTPSNERERLATLRSLKILDTPAEERFDRITRLACRVFDVPVALVTLVDTDRQWFKSNQGLDVSETPRNVSFCGHAILNDQPLVVENASEDDRFRDNPLVRGHPHIRFYAGYPLSAPDGSKLGSLCLIDRKSRTISNEDLRTLVTFGEMIEAELVALNLTTNDPLTGLSNRRGFLEIGRRLLALGTRFGHTVQLLHIQVERIAEMHRQHGSVQAERAIVEVAQVLLTCFRESDLAARTADDEFCVLVSSRSAEAGDCGVKRIDDILQSLNSQRSQELQVSVTARVETYDPLRHASLESLVTAAGGSLSGGSDGIALHR